MFNFIKNIFKKNKNDIQPDDEYLNECLKELGIDMNKSKQRESRLPRNKNGLPVINCSAGKDSVTLYQEYKDNNTF
jgi:hypothetical protein